MQKRSCLLVVIILFLLAAPPTMFAASVQLSWQPNAEPDLQEYNVYYGTQSRSYGPPIPVNKSASYTLSGLDEGLVYYFAVSAVDNNGNESGFSEEISKTIASSDTQPPTVTITSPVEENTYTTGSPTIAIAGTASDDQNLQQVTWINSTGSNGIANSTDNWTIDAIQLVEGANVITVTATDSTGKTAQDSITVTYTAVNSTNGVPVVSVASSTDDGNIAANTIDNDLSTRWSASGSGQWIQYDLGSTFSISQALIAHYVGNTRVAEFEIFVSNDASSWNSVFRGQSSGTTLQQESYPIQNATGQFVRIVGYGNSSNLWNSITEVDIVGVAASTPDITTPTISILSPTDSDTYETSTPRVQLTGTAVDDNKVAEVTWSSSTGDTGTASGTTNWATPDIDLLEGTNTITISAKDTAGNQALKTLAVVYIAPDTKTPEVTITSPVQADTYTTGDATISVSGTASDDHGLLQIDWNSSTGANGVASGTDNWSIGTIQLVEGANVITVTAADDAGNKGSATLSVMYTIPDTTAPVVTITAPTSADTFATENNRITLSGNASDDRGLDKISWTSSSDSSGTAKGTDNWVVDAIHLTEGSNVITITAIDTSGNQATDSITVTYTAPDTQAPIITISTPSVPSGGTLQTTQGSLQIAGSAQDDRSISQITWSTGNASGVAQGTTSWSIPPVSLSEGLNTITVTAEDDAGNKGSASLSVMYTIPDTVAPVVTITAPTSADAFTSEKSQISLSGTASDDRDLQQITWTSSTGSGGTASGTDKWSISGINLAEGVQVITVTATDGAGNRSSDKVTVTYDAADTTAPTVSITSPTTKAYYFARTDTVAIRGKASDEGGLAKVTWRNSRGESGTCNGTGNWQASGIKLNRWWNTITVTAIDQAGNTNEYSLKIFRWR